jgi:hypothetical protein
MNKHYEVFKKRKTDDGWSVRLRFARNRLTVETFPTIEEAEEWIRSNYKPKYEHDTPWIDHNIEGDVGHLMTIEEWKQDCEAGCLIDYDGFGSLVSAEYKFLDHDDVYPSDHTERQIQFPEEAKYVHWYNR